MYADGEITKPAPQKENWFYCPVCGKRLVKIKPGAKSEKIYAVCRGCRNEVEIKI